MTRFSRTEAAYCARTEPVPETLGADERPHLLEQELAQRWRVSVRTLQRWRHAGSGPRFLRLGRRVTYPLVEIERFEAAHACIGGRS
jgi:hypothetical protein